MDFSQGRALTAKEIAQALKEKGYLAYFAGGVSETF